MPVLKLVNNVKEVKAKLTSTMYYVKLTTLTVHIATGKAHFLIEFGKPNIINCQCEFQILQQCTVDILKYLHDSVMYFIIYSIP